MGLEIEKKLDDPPGSGVIGCALEVHRVLGPGLLESVYEHALAHELTSAGIPFQPLECGFRIDLFVDGRLVVELKSVDALLPIHQAPLLTYLRLTRCRIGLLINFNVLLLKQGLKRMVL